MRFYLFKQAGLACANRFLEIGCGTGAVLADLPADKPERAGVFGIDIDRSALTQAALHVPQAIFSGADAVNLPFKDAVFDLVFCHFLLLWVKDPLDALQEMRRVTRPGGAVLALAEPDFGGRIDYPPVLADLGRWQAESLRCQGADPLMGRKLVGIFHRAGLRQVQTGIMGGEWKDFPGAATVVSTEIDLEWKVLMTDLAGQVPPQDIQRMREADELARQRGDRVLFVPTFYAWGVV